MHEKPSHEPASIMQSGAAQSLLMLGLHSPAVCAPKLEEGSLGNLLLCNEDEGVV